VKGISLTQPPIAFLVLQSTAMSKSKIPKEECDRVSSLPDSIICHILSFLPTKYIVATSILPKRWKPLWLSVSTLDFIDYPAFLDTAPLCCLIYSVMLSRDNNLPIWSFRFLSSLKYDQPYYINQLIITATQRQTETLELSMNFHILDNSLVSKIFTCRTLTVLKLTDLVILFHVHISSTFSFPFPFSRNCYRMIYLLLRNCNSNSIIYSTFLRKKLSQ